MSQLFQTVLEASFHGGIVIAVVLLARLVLRKAPKKYICLLWLLAAVRLLMPFEIESSLSLQPELTPAVHSADTYMPEELPEAPSVPYSTTPAIPDSQEFPEDVVIVTTPNAVTEEEVRVVNSGEVLPWLWLTGSACMLVYSAVSWLGLRRRVKDAVILSEGIWVSGRIDSPFVMGFFRPQIYLTAGLSEKERSYVLAHEQCHIRRGDHWWKLLGYGILAIHWFHPLVWLGYILLCRDLEMACDEAVVKRMEMPERKAYSAALLACSAKGHTIAACPVAFGEKPVKKRIFAVLNYRKPGIWITLAAVLAVVAIALCFLTDPAPERILPDIPEQTYQQSEVQLRVTEQCNPSVTFSGTTQDAETEFAVYHFDPAIQEGERDACVYYSDAILSRLGIESEIVFLSGYEGAWTDGSTVYLGAADAGSVDFGAKLIVSALGGYVNYGAAYGYAEYICVQEGWHSARTYHPNPTLSDARDLNWLCFREGFVAREEVEANREIACSFAADYIVEHGEAGMLALLRKSGDVSGVADFCGALSRWYANHGLTYTPSRILYAIGGEYHDYLARCRYATFIMPADWKNRYYSALAADGNFLHESYPDVKLYYETAAQQMEAIQQMFGTEEDTSDITVEFLLSGTGGTWAARNQILLNYHAYIPRSYLNMMLFRHTEIRLHGGSYYEWLYHGLAEYIAQMGPSLYEDEVLLYSAKHGNPAYSTLEGDWFPIWQECVAGETDPDVYWRTRWDLLAYYYSRDLNAEGGISFTAYLVDQLGLQTVCDYFLATENPCPDIDFAGLRTAWEAYLEEAYGQYPTFSEYKP